MTSVLAATGRDLEVHELETLVRALAARPDMWSGQVRHERDRRHYVQLHRDPQVDIWLICWDAAQETGLHDHDRSSGAVHVVSGTLLEDYFAVDGDAIRLATRQHTAGGGFGFDSTYIHDVRHDGGPPAISLHAYSPALWRMGHYAVGPRGLGRTSLSYVEDMAA